LHWKFIRTRTGKGYLSDPWKGIRDEDIHHEQTLRSAGERVRERSQFAAQIIYAVLQDLALRLQ